MAAISDTGSFFTVRIPTGQTSVTVTVTPIFSDATEGPETATFTIEGSSVTVTLADEPAVTLAAPDAAAAELGPNTATVTFTRGGPSRYDREVQVAASGTAGNGPDYTLSSPALVGDTGSFFTVPIPAGQTSVTVTLTPIFSDRHGGTGDGDVHHRRVVSDRDDCRRAGGDADGA